MLLVYDSEIVKHRFIYLQLCEGLTTNPLCILKNTSALYCVERSQTINFRLLSRTTMEITIVSNFTTYEVYEVSLNRIQPITKSCSNKEYNTLSDLYAMFKPYKACIECNFFAFDKYSFSSVNERLLGDQCRSRSPAFPTALLLSHRFDLVVGDLQHVDVHQNAYIRPLLRSLVYSMLLC